MSRVFKSIIYSCCFFTIPSLCFCAHVKEYSDAFTVIIYDRFTKVTSPQKPNPHPSVIIKNETLGDIFGKIVSSSRGTLLFTNVPSKSYRDFTIPYSAEDKIIFMPLSPPLQEFELIFQKESYEIPEKG